MKRKIGMQNIEIYFYLLFVITISSYNCSDVFKRRNLTNSCFSYWYKLEKKFGLRTEKNLNYISW